MKHGKAGTVTVKGGHQRTSTPIIDPNALKASLSGAAESANLANKFKKGGKGKGKKSLAQLQAEKKKANEEKRKAKASKGLGTLSSSTEEKTSAGAKVQPDKFSQDLVEDGVGDITDDMKDLLNGAEDNLGEMEAQDDLLNELEGLDDMDAMLGELDEDGAEEDNFQAGSLGSLGGSRPAFNPQGPLCNSDGSLKKGAVKPKKQRVATPINSKDYLIVKQEMTKKLEQTTKAMSKPLNPKEAIQWDSKSVKRWGKENLPEKYHKFWSSGVDDNKTTGKELLTLGHDELKKFGFKVGVFRRNIMREIEKLKTATGVTTT